MLEYQLLLPGWLENIRKMLASLGCKHQMTNRGMTIRKAGPVIGSEGVIILESIYQ